MILSLNEIKERLIEEYDLQQNVESFSSNKTFSSKDALSTLAKIMSLYPDKVEEIEESIKDGEDFRCYFEDEDSLKELGEMRYSDPDRFYRIIRKEELFLNTCLQTFGLHNCIISLNPDKLFNDFDLL